VSACHSEIDNLGGLASIHFRNENVEGFQIAVDDAFRYVCRAPSQTCMKAIPAVRATRIDPSVALREQ
jgi:hypothetical protein